jgi:hypothetical protein
VGWLLHSTRGEVAAVLHFVERGGVSTIDIIYDVN